jgi:hypothetical protein
MPQPWDRTAPATWPMGPAQTTDNLSGLVSGTARGLGVISPSPTTSPWGDIIIPPWQITLSSTPMAGNKIYRYLLFTEPPGTLWPGGIDPTSTSDQSAALAAWVGSPPGTGGYDPGAVGGALLDVLTTTTATVYRTRWFTLGRTIGNVASYTAILVYNDSGVDFAAYSSGNQVAQYVIESYV